MTKKNAHPPTYHWVEQMNPETYKAYKKIIADEIAQVNSASKYVEHSNIVDTISAGERILILVGLEKPLGLTCLKAAALKNKLLSEKKSQDKINYFLERDGIPELLELQLAQA